MSVTVEVRLLSGKRAQVSASLDEQLEQLKRRAQIALRVGKGRLVDLSGIVLDMRAQIEDVNVKDGDSLTLHLTRAQVCGNGRAFAAILGDGSVVTWGNARFGSDSSEAQDQLKNVQQARS